jgi:putative hydrolase
MRKVLLDAHTHTVASGHAYSSLQEMAKAAADMGLEVLGITEHGPSVPGTCPTLYFKNIFVVPRQMYGIRLLMGCVTKEPSLCYTIACSMLSSGKSC